jgi:poly(3-hydroxybutyrate) depolymerase
MSFVPPTIGDGPDAKVVILGARPYVLYKLHEFNRALFAPATHLARAGAHIFSTPGSWLALMPGAASMAAGYEFLYRLGKSYGKPEFGIDEVDAHGAKVAVFEQTVLEKPFCRLQRFKRHSDRADVTAALGRDPVVLLVAPLSGHHATLLRETVRTLLGHHDVYVTDWLDARTVPLDRGSFTLDDYVDYLREFIRHVGPERLHVISVCQATVPALAAVALMAAAGEREPRSLTMMGGPIDTRCNPTQVNQLATSQPLGWFESHLLHEVPAGYPGRGRRVYPGFLQHASFVAMNPLRHASSHWDFYQDLLRGAHGDAEDHRRFYDEYNAVLDMAAEYYLDCVRIVFQEHLLPRGLWHVRGERVAPEAITGSALLTIEGALDDISGLGQTGAARDLCRGVPAERKHQLTVDDAGHYGIFSGRRWREIVYPRVRAFIAGAGHPAGVENG